MRIANGYGKLKGEVFRVAHMGETTEADIEDLLEVLDEYIKK
jgi:aspartate aminotransferase-like enzyme